MLAGTRHRYRADRGLTVEEVATGYIGVVIRIGYSHVDLEGRHGYAYGFLLEGRKAFSALTPVRYMWRVTKTPNSSHTRKCRAMLFGSKALLLNISVA